MMHLISAMVAVCFLLLQLAFQGRKKLPRIMDAVSETVTTDGPGVNKKLMRLSVDARPSTKRSSILFDNSLPIPSLTETLLKDEEDESPSGQIRINRFHYSESRFPRMEEMSHFHYNHVEFAGPVQLSFCQEQPPESDNGDATTFTVEVTSAGKVWMVKRSYSDIVGLDRQIHRCVYDRGYSHLELLMERHKMECDLQNLTEKLMEYMERLTAIIGINMNCGPVLNWFELDNHGNHLVVMEADDSAINVPAIAAAKVIKRYISQAPDEMSLEVNDFISVIDMPPNAETVWWRGKRGLEVGFFPSHCVEILAQKDINESTVPRSLTVTQRPVTKKRGKFISFLRNFFRSRPSKDELMQTGILRERVFGCDLGEHLNNTQRQIPLVLEMCSQVIEEFGIVDGIYRLSGITSNMLKLRVAFDDEEPPTLTDPKFLNDIHCISSLLKTYFRELPNPLLTYELYDRFVVAMAKDDNTERTIAFHHALQRLPPPHYRTLEYLLRHLSNVASRHDETNMNVKNLAIVWSPNLLKPDVQEYGQKMLSEIRVQAMIVEYLLKNVDLFFDKNIASAAIAYYPEVSTVDQTLGTEGDTSLPKEGREIWLSENMAITTTPPKLISLEEARARMKENKASYVNGVDHDEEDGGVSRPQHKVKQRLEPPQLASFPVSEGPSLLSIEEAQARSRSRSAKIPRRGSVDLVEYRLKSEKDGPLVPPSPSPKKRLWKALFTRSKSSSEYNEITTTMPKTASLSNYRRRVDSSSSLQSRSFSSYNLGDYIKSSNSLLDNLTLSFSNRTKKVEISEPIPHRTESFTSYIGGSDLVYVDPDINESTTDSKPQTRKSSKVNRKVSDQPRSPFRTDGASSPFGRRSVRKESTTSIKQIKTDQTLNVVSPSPVATSHSPTLSKGDLEEPSVRPLSSPSRASRRKIFAQRSEDEPIWVRASQHYQVDLLPKNLDYHETKAETTTSSLPNILQLTGTLTIATHSETDIDTDSKRHETLGNPLSPTEGDKECTSIDSDINAWDCVNSQSMVMTEQTSVASDEIGDVSNSVSLYVSKNTDEDDDITHFVPDNSCDEQTDHGINREREHSVCSSADLGGSLESPVSEEHDNEPVQVHDRLVQRTSVELVSLNDKDQPDTPSLPSRPNRLSMLTFISTSELPKPQVPIKPPYISDKLVSETACHFESGQDLPFATVSGGVISKRHSFAGIEAASRKWAPAPRVSRHDSITLRRLSEERQSSVENTTPSGNHISRESTCKDGREVERMTTNLSEDEIREKKVSTSTRLVSASSEPDVAEKKLRKTITEFDKELSANDIKRSKRENSRHVDTADHDSGSKGQHSSEVIVPPADIDFRAHIRSRNGASRFGQRPLSELSPAVLNRDVYPRRRSNILDGGRQMAFGTSDRSWSVSDRSSVSFGNDRLVTSTIERSGYQMTDRDSMLNKQGMSSFSTLEKVKSTQPQNESQIRSNSIEKDRSVSTSQKMIQTHHEKVSETLQDGNSTQADRSRKIRNNLMTRGSRELESQATSRNTLAKKAVSSDDLRSLKEGRFLRNAEISSYDSFAKEIGITERRISIEDHAIISPPKKVSSPEPAANFIREGKPYRIEKPLVENTNSARFDWVPVMQKSLATDISESILLNSELKPMVGDRRPSTYDNVVVKRASFYDNLKADDL